MGQTLYRRYYECMSCGKRWHLDLTLRGVKRKLPSRCPKCRSSMIRQTGTRKLE